MNVSTVMGVNANAPFAWSCFILFCFKCNWDPSSVWPYVHRDCTVVTVAVLGTGAQVHLLFYIAPELPCWDLFLSFCLMSSDDKEHIRDAWDLLIHATYIVLNFLLLIP